MYVGFYKDMNGNTIEAGDTIKNITDNSEHLVYENFNGDDLGLNASNEKYVGFASQLRKIYPLYQFDLQNEWVIVKKGEKK